MKYAEFSNGRSAPSRSAPETVEILQRGEGWSRMIAARLFEDRITAERILE
jgi:hypothetical protein